MSDTENHDAERTGERLRAVTPSYFGRPDAEMDAIGWGVFLGMVVVLLPLLPFLLIVLAVSKVIEAVNPRN